MIEISPITHNLEIDGLDCVDFFLLGYLVQVFLLSHFIMCCSLCFGRLVFISISLAGYNHSFFDCFVSKFPNSLDLFIVFLAVKTQEPEIY